MQIFDIIPEITERFLSIMYGDIKFFNDEQDLNNKSTLEILRDSKILTFLFWVKIFMLRII